MFKKFKDNLFSENGMRAINIMFVIAVFVGCSLGLTIVFVLWLLYLCFSFKNTKSKLMKVIYCIFAVFATAYIICSLYMFVIHTLCPLGIHCPNL